ncbi:hypothetical protein QLQ12_28905 [Actinoplanes sp. NEAU-A12]|uniref:DUF6545 domain-containing protein n=1 Tax=Actinoplanes sandaracinus TaxID=3045177 RepID=A0ABT6WSD6_9ACTN|nr:MAB_1171c family putative transporter [Actinoplanes sandaracinus]MDI6102646.1 hypothetical protein [Actinoplanes sandaracinus]
MDDVLYPLFAGIAWLAFGFKAAALRHDPSSPPLRSMTATFLTLASAMTFATPWVYLGFDAFVNVPNLARLCTHVSVMALSLSVQGWLLYWASPENLRRSLLRRGALFLVVVATMTALFVLAPVDEETLDFSTRYGDAPYVAYYMTVYVTYFGAALIDMARLSWRYSKLAGESFLRLGLRLASIGSAMGFVYAFEKGAYVLARNFDVTLVPDVVQESMGPVVGGSAAFTLVIGMTIPVWGPRLAQIGPTARRYRAYRSLNPLWSALYAARPEIALEAPDRRRDELSIDDIDYRLLRRVIEIRDARLTLRPYLSADTAETARRRATEKHLGPEETEAVVEAAVLAAGIRAAQSDTPAERPYLTTPDGGQDLSSETATLVRVARAFTRSSIVTAAVSDLEAMPKTTQEPVA